MDKKAHVNNPFIDNKRNLKIVYSPYLLNEHDNDPVSVNAQMTETRRLSGRKEFHKFRGNMVKKAEADEIIISFSKQDFPEPKSKEELTKQVNQGAKLINGFIKSITPDDAQYYIAMQRDNKGNLLHGHTQLNVVRFHGRTIDGSTLNLKGRNGLFMKLQQYMKKEYPAICHRPYHVVDLPDQQKGQSNIHRVLKRGEKSYMQELKDDVMKTAKHSKSVADFKSKMLSDYGVTVKEYQSKVNGLHTEWTYQNFKPTPRPGHKRVPHGYNVKAYHVTKKNYIRGLGKDYSPQAIQELIQSQDLGGQNPQGLNGQSQSTKPQQKATQSKSIPKQTPINLNINNERKPSNVIKSEQKPKPKIKQDYTKEIEDIEGLTRGINRKSKDIREKSESTQPIIQEEAEPVIDFNQLLIQQQELHSRIKEQIRGSRETRKRKQRTIKGLIRRATTKLNQFATAITKPTSKLIRRLYQRIKPSIKQTRPVAEKVKLNKKPQVSEIMEVMIKDHIAKNNPNLPKEYQENSYNDVINNPIFDKLTVDGLRKQWNISDDEYEKIKEKALKLNVDRTNEKHIQKWEQQNKPNSPKDPSQSTTVGD